MIRLVEVTPETLRDTWEWVRNGLGESIRQSQCDFLPEDVYREITLGHVVIFFVHQPMEFGPCGFVVLSSYTDRYSQKLVLSVDHAYLSPESDCLWELWDALYGKAHEIEAQKLEFSSARKGWLKMLPKSEATIARSYFIREVL